MVDLIKELDEIETDDEDLKKLLERGKRMIALSIEREKGKPEPVYNCKTCQDSGVIYSKDNRSAWDCKCVEAKLIQRRMEKSGLKKIFAGKTFKSFYLSSRPREVHIALAKAKNYVKNFHREKKGMDCSIAFLGASGSGKTHLTIAVANELLAMHVGVEYFAYREGMTKLKQSLIDRAAYQRTMNRYKNASVLLIDDLFKGRCSDSDINIMFEIINHRYLTKKPMIISSEHSSEKLIAIDEAIGSRIVEMCGDNLLVMEGEEINYRLIKRRG